MVIVQVVSALLLLFGVFFFMGGTVGLLRFPDVHSRLHAVTKADNLGLGLMVLGLALTATSPFLVLKLAVIWLLALGASTTACQLIANVALQTEERTG
jgi:multicomponent Na+:H+ antiporter subunit G